MHGEINVCIFYKTSWTFCRKLTQAAWFCCVVCFFFFIVISKKAKGDGL